MADRKLQRGPQEGPLVTKERLRTKRPTLYRVVLCNDDYTPMEFVVWVLQAIFYKGNEEATRLMLDVHQRGKGVCGVFTYDVARSKASQVRKLARENEYPLQCQLEAVETE